MKYTIELTDTEYNVLTGFMDMISSEIKAEYFQKAKLVPTEKAWENELEKVKLVAYNDGFEHGKLWAIKENAENYNTAINDYSTMIQWLHDCTDDFKEFMNKKYGYDIMYLTNPKVDEGVMLYDLMCDHDIAEVISEFKKWKEEKKKVEEIKVGDEIICNCPNDQRVVITSKYDGFVTFMRKDGACYSRADKDIKKTGRHFEIVEELLNQLRGNKDEKD